MKRPRILLPIFVLFCLQEVLLSCGPGKIGQDLTGTWRLRRITEYAIAGQETTVVRNTDITDPDFHVLEFQPDHTVIQIMNGNKDQGTWSLRGHRFHLRFPYRQEPEQLVRTIHPNSDLITDEYLRGDTALTVAVFRKEK